MRLVCNDALFNADGFNFFLWLEQLGQKYKQDFPFVSCFPSPSSQV